MEVSMGKAYADYTIRDISRLKGAFLAKDESQMKSFKYVEQLLMTTNFPELRDMKLLSIFAQADKPTKMIEDVVQLNTVFITQYQLVVAKRATSGHGLALLETMKADVVKATQIDFDTRIKNATNHKESAIHSYEQRKLQAQTYLASALSYREDIEKYSRLKALGADDTRDYDAITAILDNSFWCFVKYGNETKNAYFCTAQPVVVRHINPAAGIHTEVDLGYMMVNINIKTLSMYVQPFYGNLEHISRGYIHPNIGSDGDICWGTAYDEYGELIKKRDYKGLMDLACGLLMNYSDGSPYHSLEAFKSELATAASPISTPNLPFYREYIPKERSSSPTYLEVKDSLLIPMESYPLFGIVTETTRKPVTSKDVYMTHDGPILIYNDNDCYELGHTIPAWNTESSSYFRYRGLCYRGNYSTYLSGTDKIWTLEWSEVADILEMINTDCSNGVINLSHIEHKRYIRDFDTLYGEYYNLGDKVLALGYDRELMVTGSRSGREMNGVFTTDRSGVSLYVEKCIPVFTTTGNEIVAEIDGYADWVTVVRGREFDWDVVKERYPQYDRLVADAKCNQIASEVEANRSKFEDKIICTACQVTNGDTWPTMTTHEAPELNYTTVIEGRMDCWNCKHKYTITENRVEEILNATD